MTKCLRKCPKLDHLKNFKNDIQGKVEAELILFTEEEAEKSPAGLGRDDPNGLEKPT